MDYIEELERIRLAHGGILRPADVVEFAKNPNTALHSRFEWDDTEAARQYRLVQARETIRVVVQTTRPTDNATRVYVSLTDDRARDGGGYRTMDDVMRSAAMREALLKQARADMTRFAQKYQQLTELSAVVTEMRFVLDVTEPAAVA